MRGGGCDSPFLSDCERASDSKLEYAIMHAENRQMPYNNKHFVYWGVAQIAFV